MRNRRRLVLILVAISALVFGGVAWAAWTSSGAGSGQAVSRTSVDSTISEAADGSSLYPGGTTQFTVTIDNPNAYPVRVDSISAGSSQEVGGCPAGSVTSQAVTSPTGVIQPGQSGTYTVDAAMIGSAANECQGQTFTLPLTAALSSAAS